LLTALKVALKLDLTNPADLLLLVGYVVVMIVLLALALRKK
jgi:hypothetical protein